ncbi:YqiA/YcfP family alpha/beta fold hydrolase [Nitrincola tapanii]|uniref:Alpha/beta fold hydrolase n=1 Tax=Nitrincola tapanii TaxID=1708751 RepID=A0A5A9W723_9GAMM|nr:YqiA/YcfP family alpha/beta fold hydrolase [Nitrincola tapanii]KAA0876512.1 alpha/beta fold hydrolase [Nitrincola tapanii]
MLRSTPLLIYIHGFNSSPESWKAQVLHSALQAHPDADFELWVPRLSHWPAEAMAQLQAGIQAAGARPITLIGSSLGGYYALYLAEQSPQLRAVLVNPAIYPYRLLADWLGQNENLYTHEAYELTPEHLQQLLDLRVGGVTHPERYLLLVQTGDLTLDYREALAFLPDSPQFVQVGGSHGFEEFATLIPAILDFAQGELALPPATPLPFVTS